MNRNTGPGSNVAGSSIIYSEICLTIKLKLAFVIINKGQFYTAINFNYFLLTPYLMRVKLPCSEYFFPSAPLADIMK